MRRTLASLLLVLAALLSSLSAPSAAPALSAGEPYRYRGVIFGPYGKTWTHNDRMSVLGWMGRPWRDTGRPRMNIYIHAAKDDIYQRLRWRVPYPAARMNEFIDEIALARSVGVEWVPNV
ncbi:MAG: beta-N-acetylglucosaminidase domain-containing protein, partial [Actinomycetota bacterium]